MTYSKLPGVYFTETVGSNISYGEDKVPLFIVQTSTAISSIDDEITHYTNFADFKTVANNKGLPQSLKYIEDALIEYGNTEFYVYSIKTDTANGFSDAVKSTAHLTDVTSITYIEEAKSGSGNTLSSKIGAITSGLADNAANGAFRQGYIIPYGTISDAITNKTSGTTDQAAVVAAFTTLLSGDGNGRICVINPDSNAGNVLGKCFGTRYDEEAGFTALNTVDTTTVWPFDYTQMVTLQNLGVIFARRELVQGISQYRINLAVTTSFKTSAADGLLVSRGTVDEVLRRVAVVCQGFVKSQESESSVAQLNTEIGNVLNDFASEGSIVKEDTSLNAVDAGNYTFNVTGQIKPVKSVIAIEVDTTVA